MKNDSNVLTTIDAVQEARWANYANGKIKNLAHHRRLEARERELAIAALGFKPENGTAADRYAATTGELVRWAREKGL